MIHDREDSTKEGTPVRVKACPSITGTVSRVREPAYAKNGTPVAALQYTTLVVFDGPQPDGMTGAWFRPDELEETEP